MESLDAITSYDGMGWDMIPSALWIYIYIYMYIFLRGEGLWTDRGVEKREMIEGKKITTHLDRI